MELSAVTVLCSELRDGTKHTQKCALDATFLKAIQSRHGDTCLRIQYWGEAAVGGSQIQSLTDIVRPLLRTTK